MAVRFQIRGGSKAEWTSANPVLMERELGIELDTRQVKIGDGNNAWSSLPYMTQGDTGLQGEEGPRGYTGAPFVYSDFTEAQLANLIGPQGPRGYQGDPFVYTDFTLEQLEGLRGPTGTVDNLSEWNILDTLGYFPVSPTDLETESLRLENNLYDATGQVKSEKLGNVTEQLDEFYHDGQIKTEALENVKELKDFYGRGIYKEKPIITKDILERSLQDLDYLEVKKNYNECYDLYFTGDHSPTDTGKILSMYVQQGQVKTYPSVVAITLDVIKEIKINVHQNSYIKLTIELRKKSNIFNVGTDIKLVDAREPGSAVTPPEIFDVEHLNGDYYLVFIVHNIGNVGAVYCYVNNIILTRPTFSPEYIISNEGHIEIGNTMLNAALEFEFSANTYFLDWYSINAQQILPTGTNILYNVYDENRQLLVGPFETGKVFKGLAYANIIVEAVLSRDDINTPSPILKTLIIGYRGVATLNFQAISEITTDTTVSEIRFIDLSYFNEIRIDGNNIHSASSVGDLQFYFPENPNENVSNVYSNTGTAWTKNDYKYLQLATNTSGTPIDKSSFTLTLYNNKSKVYGEYTTFDNDILPKKGFFHLRNVSSFDELTFKLSNSVINAGTEIKVYGRF